MQRTKKCCVEEKTSFDEFRDGYVHINDIAPTKRKRNSLRLEVY